MFDLLIDAANACRDPFLGEGGRSEWERVDRLLAAWREQVNPHSSPLLICDESVFGDLRGHPSAVNRWQEMKRAGILVPAKEADEELLARAYETRATVLSRDRFLGWQRREPWIVGNDWQFWYWKTVGREVRIEHQPIPRAPDFDVSRAEENDELKARGLTQEDLEQGRLLSRVYACRNRGCYYGNRDALTRIPGRSSGAPRCPVCGSRLDDLGPRPRSRRLKLTGPDLRTLSTKGLADEQVIIVGRGAGVNVWNIEDFGSCPQVSRKHARLEFRGGQIVVHDLGSTNGTFVQQWQSSEGHWGPDTRVSGATTLRARDRVVLPGGYHVEQSGLKYVIPEVR